MTRSVLWDSSAILALLDADDADHAQAVAVARSIAAERRPSFITNYVEAEAHALLLRKLGRAIARQWLLTGGLPVVPVLPAEEQRAKEILARHADKDQASLTPRALARSPTAPDPIPPRGGGTGPAIGRRLASIPSTGWPAL